MVEARKLKLDSLNKNPEMLSDIVKRILRRPEFQEKFNMDRVKKPKIDRLTIAVNRGVKAKYESYENFEDIINFFERFDVEGKYANISHDIDFLKKQPKKKKWFDLWNKLDKQSVQRYDYEAITLQEDMQKGEWTTPEKYINDPRGLLHFVGLKYGNEERFIHILFEHLKNKDIVHSYDSDNVRADVEWLEKYALRAKKSSRKVCASKHHTVFFDTLPKSSNFTRRVRKKKI